MNYTLIASALALITTTLLAPRRTRPLHRLHPPTPHRNSPPTLRHDPGQLTNRPPANAVLPTSPVLSPSLAPTPSRTSAPDLTGSSAPRRLADLARSSVLPGSSAPRRSADLPRSSGLAGFSAPGRSAGLARSSGLAGSSGGGGPSEPAGRDGAGSLHLTRPADLDISPRLARSPRRRVRLPYLAGSPRLTRLWPLTSAIAILALLLGPQILVSAVAIGVIAGLIAVQRAQHQRRASAAARRAQIIEALDVLVADLSAGRPPIDALEGAASISPDFTIAHAAAKLGGDVPATLDLAAASPGAGGLRALAAAWRVSEESGAAFAALTDRLADSLRADETIHRQTEASLAGARSTARILAALPIFGIALGYSLGAKPLTFLTATPTGWLCLATGLALTATGLHWTTRLSEPPT